MDNLSIKLDFTKSNKYIFAHDDNLFIVEQEQVKSLINAQLEELDEDNHSVFYNTIFIDGNRGAGKTSFVSTLLENIKRDKNFYTEIEFLEFFDPTMIESKSSIFLTIVSLIRAKVIEKINENDDKEIRFEQKRIWEKYLETLAEGLIFLEESTNSQSFWDDPVHLMYKGFDSVNSSFNLRKNFCKFIDESLRLLDKNAFLLVIDDVDTNPDKAYDLLEVLRRYLCLKNIIVIITGDLNLYEEIVENKKKNIDKDQKFELREQYLRKILPLNKRIALKTVKEIHKSITFIENIPYELRIVTKDDILFDDYLRSIFYAFGIKSAYIRLAYINFIMNQPLRTQIDFYKLFSFYDSEINLDFFDTRSIYFVFSNELKRAGFDVNSVTNNNGLLCGKILNFLIENNCLNECYQIEPVHQNNSINTCLFALSLILAKRMKNSCELFFDYFFRIAYIKNLSLLIPSNSTRNSIRKYNFNLEDLIAYSGLRNDIDLRQISCYILAYLRQYSESKTYAAGTIILPGFADKAKGSKEETAHTFDSVIKNAEISALLKTVALLPLSVSSFSNKSRTVNEYSIFTLIASVYDLLCEFKSGDDLSVVLRRFAQVKNYLVPSELSGGEDTSSSVAIEIALDSDDGWYDFIEQFRCWKSYFEKATDIVSPYIVGKICTRIFYAYNNIIKKLPNTASLGDVMHMFVCELFHSTIIEEFTEQTTENNSMWKEISINNDNISSTDQLFISNLKKIIKVAQYEYMSLTKAIMTCPIFMYFIHFTDDNKATFDEFYQTIDSKRSESKCVQPRFNQFVSYEYFWKNNLYETLNKIYFKYTKNETEDTDKITFSMSKAIIPEEIELIKSHFSQEEFLDNKNNSKIAELFKIKNMDSFRWGISHLRDMVRSDPDLWS